MSDQLRTGVVLFVADVERIATFYSAVLGLAEVSRGDDHIRLELAGFQLVVHQIPRGRPSPGKITVPPARRVAAAFKPVFFVSSISNARSIAGANGGFLEAADREWSFNGVTVCDGVDPEGNVVQFREAAG